MGISEYGFKAFVMWDRKVCYGARVFKYRFLAIVVTLLLPVSAGTPVNSASASNSAALSRPRGVETPGTHVYGPQVTGGATTKQTVDINYANWAPTVLANFTPTSCCSNSYSSINCYDSIFDPHFKAVGQHLDARILRVCSYMWAQETVSPAPPCAGIEPTCYVDGFNKYGGCQVLGVNIYSLAGSRSGCVGFSPSLAALCGDGAAGCVLKKGGATYFVCMQNPTYTSC